jgi:ribose transport system permease protein
MGDESNPKLGVKKGLSISFLTWENAVSLFQKYNSVIILLALVIVSSQISDVFFTELNIFNLLRQLSGIGIISMGVLLVILIGGIDLSVGSILALGSVLSAYFLTYQLWPWPISILATILIGALIGSLSGYLVSKRRIAAFVATLALMTIARGLAYIISKGAPISTNNPVITDYIGNGYIFSVPIPVILMLIVFTLTMVILRYTVLGRLITAIGSNETAISYSGVNVVPYKILVFSISGGFAALAGIISTARTGVGSPLVGVGIELDAIAAVVVGGASLNGGKGTALNTLIGVLIIGLIGNIMNLLDVPAYPQQVIKGIIIIFAVLFQNTKKIEGA